MNLYEFYSVTLESDYKKEHQILLKIDVRLANDGIGSYEYWGAKGYDKGNTIIDEAIVEEAYLLREELVSDLSLVPSFLKAGVRKSSDGQYIYSHLRPIAVDSSVVESALEKFFKTTTVDDVLRACDNSDYDPRDEIYDREMTEI